ncbi:COPI associated protein-domain-containing protein [Gamsiella multidivaricata]|uniref:COPI associated protein-domain-containing protein n=1 Tax=Gamsiella multidivaricata TaxID=101098 RepID=UPI00221E7601|nr:COPI associated protein-domain-containing protein [Gamsiella multidivaricata]KAI7816736.1 COPI associated protein-domain-containing protein [Gamsiella multidivaricata]
MAQGASLFRLLNLIVAVLIILGGILLFVHIGSWNSGILGVFLCIFGLLTFALEFTIPESMVYNLGFMFSLLGRGICNMGLLTLSWRWFNILVGCIIMAVGLFYIAMHFVGATPSPSMSAVPNTSSTNLNPNYNSSQSYTNPSGEQPSMTQTYQSPDPNNAAHYDTPSRA